MDNKKIGCFLAKRRKALALTQQQLADQIGVSNKAISKWETGEGYPDITSIPELCEALGISADEFFAGDTKQTPGANYIVLDSKPDKVSAGHFFEKLRAGLAEGFHGPWVYAAVVVLIYSLICPVSWITRLSSGVQIMLVFVLPFALFFNGMHYAVKNPFSPAFIAAVGFLFLPFAVFIRADAEDMLIWALIYSGVTVLGSLATKVKQTLALAVKKKEAAERPVVERLQ